MSTRVETIDTCDRCGKTKRRADVPIDYLPLDWAEVKLELRNEMAIVRLLCPACVADVRFVLDDRPLRAQAVGVTTVPVDAEE